MLVEDKITEKLAPFIKEAALKLKEAVESKRKVLIRFHNDADGISAACALKLILKCIAVPQKNAVYTEKDAMYDLAELQSDSASLVILVDFGSGEESENGLKLIKSFGVEMLIIDHHPPGENTRELVSLMVNPWLVCEEEKASSYPAGYLASEIVTVIGKDAAQFARLSCAGDKSDILKVSDSDKDKVLVLDYVASHHDYPSTIDFYMKIISDDEIFYSILEKVKEEIATISSAIRKSMREGKVGDLNIFLLNLEEVIGGYGFPSRGKIATHIAEELDNELKGKPIFVIGYGKKSVVLRLNKSAVDSGIDTKELIAKIKITMRDFVESGGGHSKAAAIRVIDGYAKSVVEEIVKVLEKK